MCCLSQQCVIGAINSNSPSGSSPGDGKHFPLAALCLLRPPGSLGWALRRNRTQPRVMPAVLLPCWCTAPAAPPALGRASLFNHVAVGSSAVPHQLLTARGCCGHALITTARAQPTTCTTGKPLEHICKHWESTNSKASNQIQKGKHKVWKSKVLFKHKQKQLLTICSWLLKLNIFLQIAVMPVKGTCSFITLCVKDQGLNFPLPTEQSLPYTPACRRAGLPDKELQL